MSDKPFALVRIDDLATNIRMTMARAGGMFPPSMCWQLARTVSSYLRMRLTGASFIHPGMGKMATWGQCSDRQARRNFRQLRNWGLFSVVAYPKGGRRATRFQVNFTAIRVLLVEVGANPSQALCDKLREAEGSVKNPDIHPAKNPDISPAGDPDMCPDTMSAGIQSCSGAAEAASSASAALRLVGGRDV